MLNVIRAALGLTFVGIVVLMFSSCVYVAWKPKQPATCCEEEVCEEEPLPPAPPFDLISEEE